jgi:hypothetical protein
VAKFTKMPLRTMAWKEDHSWDMHVTAGGSSDSGTLVRESNNNMDWDSRASSALVTHM